MIKLFLKAVALTVVLVGSFLAGGIRHAEVAAVEPTTLIGVFSCNKLLGIAIVTGDGEVHPYPGQLTAEAVDDLQHLVPKDHQMAIHAPCGDAT
jgi:hypothetical protein